MGRHTEAVRRLAFGAALLSICGCASAPLVDATKVHPALILDIRYATTDNFTHQKVYPAARCLLRRPAAERLAEAARDAERLGYRLRVFDCYRPLSVQKRFWTLVPDERYVANPAKGSRHNRGAAVDLTLADASGKELEMPSGYDDFSERAHRDYAGASPAARKNKELLEALMTRHGFTGLATEWWHFDLDGWKKYDVLDVPLE